MKLSRTQLTRTLSIIDPSRQSRTKEFGRSFVSNLYFFSLSILSLNTSTKDLSNFPSTRRKYIPIYTAAFEYSMEKRTAYERVNTKE